MSFVDRFLGHFAKHKDFSRPSKFEVEIYLGGKLEGGRSPLQNVLPIPYDLKFQCEAAELPGYNFDTVEGRIYGAPYAVAARPAFNDLRLTFICSGDLWEKRFFDTWQEFIMPKNNYLVKYRDEYVTNLKVFQYLDMADSKGDDATGENVKPKRSYIAEFIEAFPTSIEPITLTWADDNISRLAVTFKYNFWRSIEV